MKILKPNTESTVLDRLRIVVGILLALAGVAVIILSFIGGYSGTTWWIVGFGLIVAGVIVSGSHKVAILVVDLFR